MEIPAKLKALYKHWSYHAGYKTKFSNEKFKEQKLLDGIESFATERMLIWQRRQKGVEPPYTKDPILQKYRFCNIYRELDRQTIEIHTMLKHVKDFNLWLLNILFSRFICNPETIRKIGLLSFNKFNDEKVYERLVNLKCPKYGSAYVFPISIIQSSDYPTREKFFCMYLPKVIHKVGEEMRKFKRISVIDALDKILPVFGFNFRFHWTEVLIDTAYQYPKLIDLYKEFPIGPGAVSTMKKIDPNADPVKTCKQLVNIKLPRFSYLTYKGKNVYLSAENWEGIGCEFRKYTNLSKGKGRVRRFNYIS